MNMNQRILPGAMKALGIIFVIAISFCACSSSRSVRSTDYGMVNEKLKGQRVELDVTGRHIPAMDVTLSQDSVSWRDARTGEKSQASTLELRKMVTKNHPLGCLEGLGLGVAIGGGVGALVGGALNIRSTAESGSQSSGFGAVVGLVLGGGAGVIVGSITGFAAGHSAIYEFPPAQPADSVHIGR
jgi:hypothetical protein